MDISIRSEVCRFVNFAMQQNYVPCIYSIVVSNNGDEAVSGLVLTVSAEPDYADMLTVQLPAIAAHSSYEMRPVPFKAKAEFLYSLTEKLTTRLNISVLNGDTIEASDVIDVELLAFDEWNGTNYIPEIISAFVTPNYPAINSIISSAGEYLKKWTGDPSFTGYLTQNPNNVRNQAAAIYSALQDMQITYCVPPASFEATGQRVRLCSDIVQNKLATCLDLTLLFASCLEAVSIHPIIVILQSHAFVGLWLNEQTFSECAVDDISTITKRCAEGINEIALIECTDVVVGRKVSFEQAEKDALSALSEPVKFELAIDVKRSRGGGIRPIPQRILNNGIYQLAENTVTTDKAIQDTNAPQQLVNDGRIASSENAAPLTKQQMWERKLLDLSLRNSLLNFRAKKNSVQLMIADLSALEDNLASGKAFTIMPQPSDWASTVKDSAIFDTENDKDLITTISESEFKNQRIRSFVSEGELEKNCKALYNASRNSLLENGSNTLYLALGFLRWYETDKSEKERYAPLVLIPIDIIRNVQSKTYKIKIRDEETQMNVTLLELLRQDFGIDISGLDPLPTDESGVDLQMVFNTVRHAVIDKKRWDVVNYAFIGLFSFSQFIMWNDLRNRSDDIASNKVVASLISGKLEWQPEQSDITAETLDERIKPSDLAVPSSADSSQLLAICLAAQGQSFVLHGPPGTGKSQTITNMIANALYHDKTVLFVAKKMAALSVVQSRLEKIGLGAFCLELHSNKAQKRAVLSQLERTMEVGRIKQPEQYQQTADKLYDIRCQLNNVMTELHKKRKNGLSVYDAVTMYETYAEHSGKFEITKQQYDSINEQTVQTWKDTTAALKSAAEEFGTVYGHPLSGYGRRDYSVTLRDKFSSDLANGEKVVNSFKEILNAVCQALNVSNCNSRQMCKDISDLCEISIRCPIYINDILNGSAEGQRTDYILSLIDSGKQFETATQELSQIFENSVFGINAENTKLEWKKASSSWFIAKAIGQNKTLKQLKLHAKNADSISKENCTELIEKLCRREELYKTINSADASITGIIKEVWLGENTNWQQAESIINDNITAHSILKDNGISCESYLALKNSGLAQDYIDKFNTLAQTYDTFCAEYNATADNEYWLSECENRYTSWQLYVDKIKERSQLLRAIDDVNSAGLPQLSTALEKGTVTADDMCESLLCALGYSTAVYEIEGSSVLSSFSGRSFEDLIAKFSDVTDEFRMLTINELVAKLSAKVPSSGGQMAGSSEIGILLKAIKSGGRQMPIRKLFDSIPSLLHRICPCMLMSPISVAQYIDPSYPKFDLVIFDEASQLPTSEAVGAIARGSSVIVVGDPKQLPPTSFFSVSHVNEENYEKEDLESVLDDCLAISMPQEHLLWHYRSRHESLIAYSNARYYDNKLYTFPSPNDLESKVTLVKVDGYYDKGGTKQNRAEAEAIVKEIERRLDDEQLRKESIGIVTFSIVQQTLIDDLLTDKFRERPELEQLADQLYEPLFIKNLENVQGDERDVILFSVGYGPDKNGKVSMNFGPINKDGGWRRLNVAISRARKCMTVFSTITYDMIDMSRTSSEGVGGLKGFLEFAQKGRAALTVRSGAEERSQRCIEKLVAAEIEKAGYSVRCNIGCSECKVDIGVIDPRNSKEYILGIMCDGDSYKLAKTANDRDLSLPSVLRGLGWNLIHIWSLDWFDDKQKVMKTILAAINDALSGSIEQEERKASISVSENSFAKDTETEETSDRVKIFTMFTPAAIGTPTDLYSPGYVPMLKNTMRDVINALAPVSRKTLFKQTLAAFGAPRSTAKADGYLTDILGSLDCIITKSNNSAFVWSDEVTPENMNYFRMADGEKRPIDDICAEEIANAAMYVLEKQLTLTRADLTREVAKCFGYSRTTPTMETSITEGIVLCKSRGMISISPESGKISLI